MSGDPAAPDCASLARYLAGALSDFAGPVTATKFKGGQSNPTYLLETAKGRYVLRRKPPGKLLPSAHAVDREFRVIAGLAGSAVPVPRAIHLCEDDAIIGSAFYLMSYEEGRIFWDPALPGCSNEERGALFEQLITTLAALHEVDADAAGLGDYGPRGQYFERQVARWSKQYRAAETELVGAMEALLEWLPANLPPDTGRVSLIHGDYRLDNVIFAGDGPRIQALLDWELSTLGDPLADLAYFCMCLRLPRKGLIKGLAGLDRAELGIPEEARIVARYCELRGLDGVPHWRFALAFSFFRLAAICQGVLRRALDGNASSEQALQVGRSVSPLASAGAALIDHAGEAI